MRGVRAHARASRARLPFPAPRVPGREGAAWWWPQKSKKKGEKKKGAKKGSKKEKKERKERKAKGKDLRLASRKKYRRGKNASAYSAKDMADILGHS